MKSSYQLTDSPSTCVSHTAPCGCQGSGKCELVENPGRREAMGGVNHFGSWSQAAFLVCKHLFAPLVAESTHLGLPARAARAHEAAAPVQVQVQVQVAETQSLHLSCGCTFGVCFCPKPSRRPAEQTGQEGRRGIPLQGRIVCCPNKIIFYKILASIYF